VDRINYLSSSRLVRRLISRVPRGARAIMDRTKMNDELTDADVLRVDPVHEYERRYHMREVSESILSRVGDDSDPQVAQGRPTGP